MCRRLFFLLILSISRKLTIKLSAQETFFYIKARIDLARTATLAPESAYYTTPTTLRSASIALVAAFYIIKSVCLRYKNKTATAKWLCGT